MQVNAVPEKLVNYNVYLGNEKLIGLAAEVTLPSLEAMSETISGAGILGEYESPTPGHFGSLQMELTFRVLYDKSFRLLNPNGETLIFRASQQHYDVSSGQINHRGLKVTTKILPKGIDLGKLAVGGQTETKNKIEVVYIKIEENGKVLLELDKLNFVYIVNGIDVLANIRNQI